MYSPGFRSLRSLGVRISSPSSFRSSLTLLAHSLIPATSCPPFSDAGLKLGEYDDRDLFPEALRLVAEIEPKAVMLENVRGLFNKKFKNYRDSIEKWLNDHGYQTDWRLVNSSDYGVPQLRPRTILIAMKPEYFIHFKWPDKKIKPKTVGEALYEDMSSQGWLEPHPPADQYLISCMGSRRRNEHRYFEHSNLVY